MFYNKRKTIGVFLEAIANQFQNRLCQGIITQAEQLGYNVAIFAPYGKYGENTNHFLGDQALYELPDYAKLDGVILALDTMQELESREKILQHIREKCRCPIVSIREIVEGANNFLVENKECLDRVISHFVEKHGFTRLCCMTGPKSHWDAVERMKGFQRKMQEYDLPVDEHQIFWGDYWNNMGREACDWFLQGKERPQAIICANDMMAFAVTSELIGRGIRVPEDICVSGYDGMDDTLYFVPSMTTVAVPVFEMGQKAVQRIDERQEHPELTDDVYFETQLVVRETCGCLQVGSEEAVLARRNQYESSKENRNRRVQFDYFSIHLGDCNTYAQVGNRIWEYCWNISGLQDYAICLSQNWEDEEEAGPVFSDTMELRIGIKDGMNMGDICIPFERNELLPAEITGCKPQIWYFTSIHYQDSCYGYEAFQFRSAQQTGQLHFRWNVIIGNKFRDMLVAGKMERLIAKLEYMYDRDALTGMYNRRGWENHGIPLFEEAKQMGEKIFLAVVDLDGMKQINDNYGHAEGDFALCKIGEILDGVCRKDGIMARTGGDEFAIIIKEIAREEGIFRMQQIEHQLDKFNASEEKPYQIHASYGYMWGVPEAADTIESYTVKSDEGMYRCKLCNKMSRGEKLR